MRRLAALGALAALGLGCAHPASAQEATPEPLQIERVTTESHPQVTVTVAAPSPVVGLDLPAEAFTLSEDGQERPIEVAKLPSDGLEVVLAIDTSGSMGTEPMAAAKAAATAFVDRMPPSVSIAVVGFGTAPQVLSDFTTDPEAVKAAIASLQSDGRTSLYDGTLAAVGLFATENARRAVVLLSDGGDNESAALLSDAVMAVEGSGAALHIVELVTLESDSEALLQLAAPTTGGVVSADDPAGLAAVYDQVASRLVNSYAVTFTSQEFDATEITVSLAHEGMSAMGTLAVQFPSEPAPPPPELEPEPAPAAPPPEPTSPPVPVLRPGVVVAPGFFANPWVLAAGAAIFYLSLALLILLLLAPRQRQRRLANRHRGSGEAPRSVTTIAQRATRLADDALQRRGQRTTLNNALERAGLPLRPGEYVVLTGCAVVTAAALGFILGGITVGLPFAVIAGVAARLLLPILGQRRQARFADQLGETLQLMAGSLRSGYGVMQAIDVVASETASPTREEFSRLVVENRLGRDLHESLRAMAVRLGSDDFAWVVQAIEIHRDVGGDLAEVLDNVAQTIRERNQLRRQVRTLSAEGRISAYILFALPFACAGLLLFINPGYLAELPASGVGRAMLVAGACLMVVGAVWLKRVIKVTF